MDSTTESDYYERDIQVSECVSEWKREWMEGGGKRSREKMGEGRVLLDLEKVDVLFILCMCGGSVALHNDL